MHHSPSHTWLSEMVFCWYLWRMNEPVSMSSPSTKIARPAVWNSNTTCDIRLWPGSSTSATENTCVQVSKLLIPKHSHWKSLTLFKFYTTVTPYLNSHLGNTLTRDALEHWSSTRPNSCLHEVIPIRLQPHNSAPLKGAPLRPLSPFFGSLALYFHAYFS